MALDIYTLAGSIGAGLIIVAYFASQRGWVGSHDRGYLLANLAGALLILVSLWAEWNLPSAVIECFWAAISVYGLVTSAARKRPG
ncbi:MAG: CBU_0592 family membrane protein [Solirubrobacteraceae bacterium]